jgi:hypothetical protein
MGTYVANDHEIVARLAPKVDFLNNPSHLQAISASENSALGKLRNTHCPSGHEYDYVKSQGYRGCRTCERSRNREARDRRKAQPKE